MAGVAPGWEVGGRREFWLSVWIPDMWALASEERGIYGPHGCWSRRRGI